jgi:hypothetical protein
MEESNMKQVYGLICFLTVLNLQAVHNDVNSKADLKQVKSKSNNEKEIKSFIESWKNYRAKNHPLFDEYLPESKNKSILNFMQLKNLELERKALMIEKVH